MVTMLVDFDKTFLKKVYHKKIGIAIIAREFD